MKRCVLTAIVVVLLSATSSSQTARTHITTGASLPANCTVGDAFVKTGSSAGLYWCSAANTWTGPLGTGTGGGSVTSVAMSVPSTIFSVSGSPITTSGTLAVSASGTSGGIPYFSSASALGSSMALTADLPVIGGGAGTAPAVGTRSGNTTQFVTTTGTLTSGDCVKIDASGNFVSNGSGCGTSSGISASSVDTLTNKTIDAEGTGNVITIPMTFTFTIAACQNTTAILTMSTPTTNPAVAACVTGTNTQYGVLQFADGANSLSVQGHFQLPSDWTGNVDVKGKWRTSATTGSVVWQVATACVADAETGDPSFNTASTTTDAAKGTANQFNDWSMSNITMTGCAAGEEFFFKFFRDPANGSDDLAATAELISLHFVLRRAI